MGRIRTVKPELFKHVNLWEAEYFYKLPLRLAYIGLFNNCDRAGRFQWQMRRLKVEMFPYDDFNISAVFNAFVKLGFIQRYEYQGDIYGAIPSWARHQYINNREEQSSLPSIEESTILGPERGFEENNLIIPEKCPMCGSCMEHLTREARVGHASGTREARVQTRMEQTSGTPERGVQTPVGHVTRACTSGREGKGREEEGKEGRKGTLVASETRPSGLLEPTFQIFEHWKTVMEHPNAQLDSKRSSLIAKALSSGYSVQQLCDAITGCSYTPHNRGDNDRNQRYDGLHIILRDSDQIDRFIHNSQRPPRPITETARRSEATVQTLQRWIEKKKRGDKSDGNL